MAEISTIRYSQLAKYLGRIDAEFYKPQSLYADEIIRRQNHQSLGLLVEDGYRVVYENTKILKPQQVNHKYDARFLQATNISPDGLWIDINEIGFVSVKDWDRYPKGRIKRGEILIEVKAQAEKVTIVQDYLPERILVTGTLFKLSLRPNTVSHEYLFSFFSSRYGKVLRDRTKVNTLIAYVSKPELYRIPIPIPEKSEHDKITNLVHDCFRKQALSKSLFNQATKLLESELGLNNSDLKQYSNKYISTLNELTSGNRIDSEYFNPRVKEIVKRISNLEHTRIGLHFRIKNGYPWNSKRFLEDNSGEPVIRIRDVKQGYIENERLTSLVADYAASINFPKAQPGDIVIGMDGIKYFLSSIVEEPCLVNQRVCHISPKDSGQISSEYVSFIINSEVGQAQLLRDMTIATTVGHITNANVAKLIIPIVSKEFHDEITNLVRGSIEAQKESKRLLEQAKTEVETLIEHAAKSN